MHYASERTARKKILVVQDFLQRGANVLWVRGSGLRNQGEDISDNWPARFAVLTILPLDNQAKKRYDRVS